MALDPRYVTAVSLEPYFVDKDTGAPLSGGIVSFWQDNARTVPKLVYELSGAPPNYTYTALPNPLILSSVGTFQDTAGNNIAVYYFPYDANGNLQLYYITVMNSMGVEQFTREAWPNVTGNEIQNLSQANISNQLTNPQFANVLFIPSAPLVITVTGAGTLNVNIAPGWTLNITSSAAGSVTVTQNSISGVTAYPYNPPYTLTITPGLNVTGLTLTQTLSHNPDIWSPQAGAQDGYIATSILLAPLSSVSIQYAPSTGAPQTILNANNLTGVYTEFSNTVQLAAAANPDNATIGFVNIVIVLPPANPTTLGSVQVVGLESNETIVYEQTTVNRQIDQMFNYFNPLLQFKPIQSHLTGWDFSLNPSQPLGDAIASQATGNNTSYYTWDQTILYQSVTNSLAVSRGSAGTAGSFRLTASANTQFAIIQYLNTVESINALVNRLSSVVVANTNQAALPCTISLWFTAAGALPNVNPGTNLSIVSTLTAAGKPATFNGAWTEVTRNILQDATFTVTPGFHNFGFSGWDATAILAANAVTFMAVVVGFGVLTAGNSIEIDSVSLVPGDIPTIPGVQKAQAVLSECQYYYSKSFPSTVVPIQNLGENTGELIFIAARAGATGLASQSVFFPVEMRATPIMTGYSPEFANAQCYDESAPGVCTNTIFSYSSTKSFAIQCSGNAGTIIGNSIGLHWTADARLGIV